MTGEATATSLLAAIFGTLSCSKMFQCSTDLDSSVGIVLWFMVMVYMFKQLGTICDEYFVPSLEVIVEKLEIPNDVAGATFMAAGSSAPELFTSLVATFLIVNEGGIGTIVGSAIFNILVIVGATGLIACKDQSLNIWWYPLTRDCAFYTLAIIELTLVLRDEEVHLYEALIMFFTYILYCLFMVINPWVLQVLGLDQDEASQTAKADAWQDPVTEVAVAGISMPDASQNPEDLTKGAPSPSPSDAKNESVPCDSDMPNAVPSASKPVAEGAPHLKAPVESTNKRSTSKDSARVSWSMHQHAQEQHEEKRRNSKSRNSKSSNDSVPTLVVVPDCSTIVCTTSLASAKVSPADCETHNQQATALSAMTSIGTGATSTTFSSGSAQSELTGIWRFLRDPLTLVLEQVMPSAERHHWTLFSLSIFFIATATYLMVDATNRIGIILKVPPLVMGLVFLAAGTSIPDAMGSIAVAKQGEGDMAIANALGSNVFDILIGLGVPWAVRTASGEKVRFEGKFDDIKWDILILAGVLGLFVGALVLNRWQLTRRVGMVLCFFYVLNVVYNGLTVWVFETKKED